MLLLDCTTSGKRKEAIATDMSGHHRRTGSPGAPHVSAPVTVNPTADLTSEEEDQDEHCRIRVVSVAGLRELGSAFRKPGVPDRPASTRQVCGMDASSATDVYGFSDESEHLQPLTVSNPRARSRTGRAGASFANGAGSSETALERRPAMKTE